MTSCENFTTAVTYQGKVVKVLDGDSINILHQGKPLRIRLAEIDAPEYSQPFWEKSKQALEGYVRGKTVEVEEFDVDQYGRVVGHVYVGNFWVNGELVRNGFAYVYTQYAVSKRLYEYENEAEKNKKGKFSSTLEAIYEFYPLVQVD
ncbi:thermonuclease family protein [candidate division KSB1 bacterium]|nr:thermonuclease family protein [candidate division KSB1 bacterium]